VSGGDDPGSLGTAGTMPTSPDAAGAVPLLAAAFGATDARTLGVAVVCEGCVVLSCEAVTVASGFPLGSTRMMMALEVAAALFAALCAAL
jgi:hypothetical protein